MEHKVSHKKRVVAAWLNRLPTAGMGLAIDYQQSHGLSNVDAKAMELLHTAPMGPCQLAEKLQMSPAGITKLVDRLEDRGLVKRRRHPADRRRALVAITDKALVSGYHRQQIQGLINKAVHHAPRKQLDVLYEFFLQLDSQLAEQGLIHR